MAGGSRESFAAKIVTVRSEVLNALLTARTLFDRARRQCAVRDCHIASAGLIVLQDALNSCYMPVSSKWELMNQGG